MTTYLRVALPVPLYKTFDYVHDAEPMACEGTRVAVPFANRNLVGVVVGTSHHSDVPLDKIKAVEAVLEKSPSLSTEILALCQWVSEYYHHPIGEVLALALPANLRNPSPRKKKKIDCWTLTPSGLGLSPSSLSRATKQKAAVEYLLEHGQIVSSNLAALDLSRPTLNALQQKGLVETYSEEKFEDEFEEVLAEDGESIGLLKESPKSLNQEQQSVFKAIHYHKYHCYLLHGATGSGKTEVYMQAIARVLQTGKQALLLVPEIGLTPQTLARISARFSVNIAELHSKIGEAQREKHWQSARNGKARIIIGTRLAAFASFHDLGLIIIDEEHDLSYKQHDNLRYSARDVCIYRASKLGVPVILGSATPSLESLHAALSQRYKHLRLHRRAGGAEMPSIHRADLKSQKLQHGLLDSSIDAITHTLEAGHQAMVFVNRRGFAGALLCQHCGWTATCQACDMPFTLHSNPSHLHCHYCDAQRRVPRNCQSCNNNDLLPLGAGTERIEGLLKSIFHPTPVFRVDRDTAANKSQFDKILTDINSMGPCLIVGTQMLAKGHHLPSLKLVVVANADYGLLSADFRGPERMGQMLTQVAGRAGREGSQGSVIVQSYCTDHPLLELLLTQGYAQFAERILEARQQRKLPPFSYMALLRAESKRAQNAIELLKLAKESAVPFSRKWANYKIIGPLSSSLEKINDRFRYQLQINCDSRQALHHSLKHIVKSIDAHALSRRTRWSIDVDPLEI